jgi:hypothetical protein
MAKRKITGREVLKDIKAGMDDPELMDKYKLSAQGLQSVFNKLVNAGVLTQAELDARVPVSERTVELGLYICPACGNIQGKEFIECPRCGFVAPTYLKQQKEQEAQEKSRSRARGKKSLSGARSGDSGSKSGSSGRNVVDDENHKDAAAGPLFDFAPVIRYCNGLAVAALVSYILVIAALFAVIQTSPVAAKLDVTELLLVTLALVLPALITALVLFVALRALAQSMRAFASMLAGMPGSKQQPGDG